MESRINAGEKQNRVIVVKGGHNKRLICGDNGSSLVQLSVFTGFLNLVAYSSNDISHRVRCLYSWAMSHRNATSYRSLFNPFGYRVRAGRFTIPILIIRSMFMLFSWILVAESKIAQKPFCAMWRRRSRPRNGRMWDVWMQQLNINCGANRIQRGRIW